MDRDVGLGDVEPFPRGRRIAIEELAIFAKEANQLENCQRWRTVEKLGRFTRRAASVYCAPSRSEMKTEA
jgi:hypothetical protein